jgi:hypothetical protein
VRVVTTDLVSATSLLVGAVGLLYSGWNEELRSAQTVPVRMHVEDRGPERLQVRQVLRTRALPLAAAAWALVLVFLPPAVNLVVTGVRALVDDPVGALGRYDPVPLAFLAVIAVDAGLACTALLTVVRLRGLLRRLDEP